MINKVVAIWNHERQDLHETYSFQGLLVSALREILRQVQSNTFSVKPAVVEEVEQLVYRLLKILLAR